ncbi:hypothetical protein RvY_19045-1 [Ramazzottius varieornatus]|uniref:Uncharacterized protein n=1 Tax=Ramazzottius varieornatus TaxID=947166 RepID=A0A1D1WC05_RAMVA|nr:hypothetical protein RvY_19045-1 [Ramazzottius varieornatus]
MNGNVFFSVTQVLSLCSGDLFRNEQTSYAKHTGITISVMFTIIYCRRTGPSSDFFLTVTDHCLQLEHDQWRICTSRQRQRLGTTRLHFFGNQRSPAPDLGGPWLSPVDSLVCPYEFRRDIPVYQRTFSDGHRKSKEVEDNASSNFKKIAVTWHQTLALCTSLGRNIVLIELLLLPETLQCISRVLLLAIRGRLCRCTYFTGTTPRASHGDGTTKTTR